MAYDKIVDSTALDAAMTYTANRIRNKMGDTNQIVWDSAKGFGDAVDAITSGSSAPESDPREVYQGTRPAEWLRLPDYDKVGNNTVYFLFELFPYGTNTISLQFRTAGVATITAGVVSNGEFIPFENDNVVSMQGEYYGWKAISRTFNYADYDTVMSCGTKQIVIQFHTTSGLNRIAFGGSSNGGVANRGIRDIIIHKEGLGEGLNCFIQQSLQRGCLYYYAMGAGAVGCPTCIKTLMYAQHADGVIKGSMSGYSNLIKILGTYKKLDGDYNEFTNCYSLIELTFDISDWIKASGPSFNTCYSLRKLLFTNGENLTSFPANLNLTGTALEADAVLAFFNTLPDISTSETARTITLKNTPAAAAGIPEATLAVATNKGWTVVTA